MSGIPAASMAVNNACYGKLIFHGQYPRAFCGPYMKILPRSACNFQTNILLKIENIKGEFVRLTCLGNMSQSLLEIFVSNSKIVFISGPVENGKKS